MKFEVRGTPAPQGSKRAFRNKHTGHIQQVESSAKVKPWRAAVCAAAVEARDGGLPMDGPLAARMVFTLVRPRNHYRTGRNSALLKADAPMQPCSAPDLSKLLRSTEDALKEARLIEDDSRIVEYERVAKVYASEDPEALDSLGAVIEVWKVGDRHG